MKKESFVSSVLAFLKGGDQAKLSRFADKLVKKISKDIATRKDAIENLSDKIADAQDALAEVVTNVNTERISKTDTTEDYAKQYLEQVIAARQVITDLNEQVTYLNEEIAVLEQASTDIFGE